MSNWVCDVENWHTIPLESASMIATNAEMRLEATVSEIKHALASTDKYLNITIPIAGASLGYALSGDKLLLQCIAFFALLFFIPALIFIFKNLKSIDYHSQGIEPKTVLTGEIMDNQAGNNEDWKHLGFFIVSMEICQEKIDYNKRIVDYLGKNLKWAKYALLFSPISIPLASLYLHLFGYHLCWCVPQ